ncbi:MAG: MarR family transcriptional regulator [Lachnospiraceae bacterium]|nr:MarR family transcriptional regulator [Lachnospiraceae bacterium]
MDIQGLNRTISFWIKQVDLRIDKGVQHALAAHDLSSTQLKILVILYTHPEQPFRQKDLEQQLQLTNPTVTGILSNMERKGLIRRVKNPLDSRSKVVELTERSHQLKDELMAFAEDFEEKLTHRLSVPEREQLISLLKKLSEPGNSATVISR